MFPASEPCRGLPTVLVLAPTRWKLPKAVVVVNHGLDALGLEKHPDKTFIGRIPKGFDFLGYHVAPAGLAVAEVTLRRFAERIARLHEQEPWEPAGSARLGMDVRRWVRRVNAVLDGLTATPITAT